MQSDCAHDHHLLLPLRFSPRPIFGAVLLGAAALGFGGHTQAADYYIDMLGGDDTSDGLTPLTAWQTISRVNAAVFAPGDRIRFSGQQLHPGNLVLTAEDSGTPASPVIVGSYGSGRATLYAAAGDGIVASDTGYVTISNLDVTGPGWNARLDGSRGVVLSGSAHHCIVEQLTVSGFHKAGVRTENATHDNAITFVTAQENGFIGIHISGDYQLVSDCRALRNHGDPTVTNNWSGSGILVDDASYVVVEYSEAAFNGSSQPWTGNGPVGIWCWNADHVTFRRCISHDNMRGNGNADGGGFDLDGGTTDSLVEYCYSYNNTGPGFMVYNFKWQNIPNRNNTVRYCISENDAQGGVFLGTSGVALENIEIHNVTAFNTNGARVFYNSSGTKKNVNVRDSVFLTTGKLTINGNGVNLQGNCYHSSSGLYAFGSYGANFAGWAAATGDEMHNGALVGLNADPQLLDVGSGSKLTDPRALTTLRSYSAASESSPVIDAGLDLPTLFGLQVGGSDIIGAGVPVGAFDIGAYEFHPASLPDATPPSLVLTAPGEGAIVAGMLLVSADVADESTGSGVAGVRFLLDGAEFADEVTTEPYSAVLDTSTVPNGLHTLGAIARDAAGNVSTMIVDVTVENAPPLSEIAAPSITVSTPTEGSTVSGIVALSAEAAPGEGGETIAGVQFQVDGMSVGEEVVSAPYSIAWDTTSVADGEHVISAIVRDSAGTTAISSVTVFVSNPAAILEPITLDNADANVTVSAGWAASRSVSGYHGADYLAATAGNKSVRFAPVIPRSATYDVYVRWTAHTNRATNAPVDVVHAGGVSTFALNMRSNGGVWVLLGTFSLDPATAAVTVRADGANGYVVADAVRLEPR